MKTSPSISVSHLSKTYFPTFFSVAVNIAKPLTGRTSSRPNRLKAKKAVDDVSLQIKSGERVGIIGRNGAGKSTLLHLIAGMTAPSFGQIDIQGKVTAIFSLGTGLRDDLSGKQNIFLSGELQGKSRSEIESAYKEITEFANIGEFIDLPLRTYSTGMKARLAFAMLALEDPEILIIDEALSVGDSSFAQKAKKKIRELCDSGKIVIVVSHDLRAIKDICDRCLWIDSGKVAFDGSPVEATTRYLHAVAQNDDSESLAGLENSLKTRFGSLLNKDFTLSLHQSNINVGHVPVLFEGQPFGISSTYTNLKTELGWYRLRLERLDGVLVDETIREARQSNKTNTTQLEIKFPSLILAPGVYVFTLELLDSIQAVPAATFRIFRVMSENEIAGGKPLLYYHARITPQEGSSVIAAQQS